MSDDLKREYSKGYKAGQRSQDKLIAQLKAQIEADRQSRLTDECRQLVVQIAKEGLKPFTKARLERTARELQRKYMIIQVDDD